MIQAQEGAMDRSYLRWPFFDASHRELAARIEGWAADRVERLVGDHHDADAACRRLVAALGEAGFLRYAAPDVDGGERFDLRAICLIRETLARHAGLADFAFAMQGLGTATAVLFGGSEQRRRWTADVRAGKRIAAFAISEPEAGSDVAAMSTVATPAEGGWRLNGRKTWISNGGIADQYVVFTRTPLSAKSFVALMVEADAPGLSIAERIDISAPHPMATLSFDDCFVPDENRLGEEGAGLRAALATLDVFRPSVGAAALGLARRALDEALAHARARPMFGGALADLQLTQARLAEMALDVDASALLVYRAAWAKDEPQASGAERITGPAAMAKLYATEAAQGVIDKAVQLFGAEGVRAGSIAERLYREIRAMRIYEGATEVQKVVIARQLLKDAAS
jgi:acyl-CoA dehydrogenase